MFIAGKRLLIVILISLPLILSAQTENQWRRGIVRVNTDISAGLESCEEVAQLAQNADIDFIVFSDQFLVRAEYGIFPFRKSLKFCKTRKSIVSFGIENYLKKIEATDKQFPDMVLIPGVDIAPHYYWTGKPFSKEFSTNQFSQQLTIFGPSSYKFYRELPVIHNEKTDFSLISILKLLPLLFVFWGIALICFRNVGGYSDRQGNVYGYKTKRARIFAGLLMIIIGMLWTIENRPFTKPLPFDQYSDFGKDPYQYVINYIRKNNKDKRCAIFWSAPEAKMTDSVYGVKMVSMPYFEDIMNTTGHNGFAGIYGDTATAHKPGHEWDTLLMEYCEGKRSVKPVIIGELDYHGKRRKIDLIQTVVAVDKFDAQSIVNAICEGNSYAYANIGTDELIFEEISLKSRHDSAGMGEILKITEGENIILTIKGRIKGYNRDKTTLRVTVVVNGKATEFLKSNGSKFNLKLPLKYKKEFKKKGYIRFLLETNQAGRVVSNPIFLQKQKNSTNP